MLSILHLNPKAAWQKALLRPWNEELSQADDRQEPGDTATPCPGAPRCGLAAEGSPRGPPRVHSCPLRGRLTVTTLPKFFHFRHTLWACFAPSAIMAATEPWSSVWGQLVTRSLPTPRLLPTPGFQGLEAPWPCQLLGLPGEPGSQQHCTNTAELTLAFPGLRAAAPGPA